MSWKMADFIGSILDPHFAGFKTINMYDETFHIEFVQNNVRLISDTGKIVKLSVDIMVESNSTRTFKLKFRFFLATFS